MEGVAELAEQIFNLPVRVGMPTGIKGLVDVVSSPMYSTAVGLVKYGVQHATETQFKRGGENVFNKMLQNMRGWAKDFF